MKINRAKLTELVKEEYMSTEKNTQLLEARKAEILNLLNEIENCNYTLKEDDLDNEISDEMIEEILGKLFGGQNKEEKRNMMAKLISNHPHYSRAASNIASKYNKDEAEISQKLLDFFVKEATIVDGQLKNLKSFIFDPKTDMFVNKTKFTGTHGPTGGADTF